jgi:hypothetical protein
MAISTDAAPQSYLVATSESAEVRSLTSSGLSGNGDGLPNPVTQNQRNGASQLQTEIIAEDEVSFETTKESARKIGALTSDSQYESLIAQRQVLARKELDNCLSKSDLLQLRLIEWTINCVEKSRAEVNLESLHDLARSHEIIADRVIRTTEQLQAIIDAENHKNAEASRQRYKRFA